MNLTLLLVGAGEHTSLEDGSRHPYLRFRSVAGEVFDLPCTEDQLTTLLPFAWSNARPADAPPPAPSMEPAVATRVPPSLRVVPNEVREAPPTLFAAQEGDDLL